MQRPWKPRYNDGSYGQWNEGRNGIDVEFVGRTEIARFQLLIGRKRLSEGRLLARQRW